MSNIRTKILVGTLLLLPFTLKTCRNDAKEAIKMGKNLITATIKQPVKKDTFQMGDSTVKSVLKQVADEEKLEKETATLVKKHFDEESSKFLMLTADSPAKQKCLCQVIEQSKKIDRPLSSYTTSEIINCNDKDQFDFNMRLISAKKANNEYYSEDGMSNIMFVMGISSSPQTIKMADNMIKNKFPEEIIPKIIHSTHSFNMKEDFNKKELAVKLIESKGKDGKAQFTPEEILQKITDYKLPLGE